MFTAIRNQKLVPSGYSRTEGTFLQFKLQSSLEMNTSTHLFTTLGGSKVQTINSKDYYYVDSHVRVTGATTGRSVDVPVRFLKRKV